MKQNKSIVFIFIYLYLARVVSVSAIFFIIAWGLNRKQYLFVVEDSAPSIPRLHKTSSTRIFLNF